ncbi:MAG: histidine phosphatase family protein [Leadbetterella sp.]
MKITFIRHSKVLFKWAKVYTSASFDTACKDYDTSKIEIGTQKEYTAQIVYISTLSRTEHTAYNCIAGNKELIKTDLLNEIPLQSFFDTTMRLPTLIWHIIGRLQWYVNSDRQPETRRESIRRINQFLDLIEGKNQDCLIIGHGFFFAQMTSELKKRGIKGDMRKRLRNEECREFDFSQNTH